MSIVDLARAAGVSVTTVSRVINNADYPVREATRQRVLKAAAELEYSPSALARALVTRRTRIVGVVVHDILDPYFGEIVRGIQDAAGEHGYLTIVCNSDRQVATELNYLRLFRDYRVDGIILAGGGQLDGGPDDADWPAALRIQEKGTRIIALAPQPFPTHLVTIDNQRASREMTAYLLGLGHRRIGFIEGPPRLLTSRLRRDGFAEALAAVGQPPDPELIVPGNFDLESGARAASHFLGLDRPPTAIFATNDEMAVGCLETLRRRGVRVPADVSVVGFDDVRFLQFVDPRLTTVHVPLHDLGATAMRQLLRALDDEPIEPTLVLEHELVVRESSAPPGT
ncbi:MAG: LacI family DNA-binding transcriptional regulator [Chloroflexota bacterium]